MLFSCVMILLCLLRITMVLTVNAARSDYEKGIKKDSNRAKKTIHFWQFSRIRRKSNSQETGNIEVSQFSLPHPVETSNSNLLKTVSGTL